MLHKGQHVPDFDLPLAFADGRKDPVQLKTLLAEGPVVLSFFPLAFTRVCTTQMCDARDREAELLALGARVFGFSCDTPWTNVHFAKEHALRHGIFSDANRDVVDKLWETQDVAGVRRVPKRGWMVVAPDGTLADLFVADASGAPWPGTEPIAAAVRAAASRGS